MTHAQLAKEVIGFSSKTFTDAEWKIEAARIRAANEKRKAKLKGRLLRSDGAGD